jgi:hypothetical protein
MRSSRKLLLVVLTGAAMGIAAPSAFAQSVEVLDEPGGAHCAAVTMQNHLPVSGDCIARVASDSPVELYLHDGLSEILFSTCSMVFELALGEDGDGFAYNQALTPEGGACGREPCDEAEVSPTPHRSLAWPVQLQEPASGSNREVLALTVCLYAHNSQNEGFVGTACTFNLDVVNAGHAYEFSTPHDLEGNGGAVCAQAPTIELEGHWLTEPDVSHPNTFEVVHLDDL